MNKFLLFIYILFIFACTTSEEEPKPDGFGELIREGYPTEINPFQILKKTAHDGLVKVDAPTILKKDVDDYYPLRRTDIGYIFSIKIPAKDYTEDEYRFSEEDGIAEYRSYVSRDQGVYLFLAQREMPSYDWYHVLKVCSTEENKGFRLEGVVL